MISSQKIRLPGVYFLPPPRTEAIGYPPLDVPAFVGFAERGPLHLPVAVEDMATYRAIFGGDLPLAQETGGRIVNAHLPDAVQAFFANGGRRCYVVRVAGQDATRSRFRLPGMVALDAETGLESALATIHAAWEGAWPGQLTLASQMRITPLPASAFSVVDGLTLRWQSNSAPDAIQEGDLLQLSVDGESWLFPVSDMAEDSAGSSNRTLTANRAWRLIDDLDNSPPLSVTSVERAGIEGTSLLAVTAVLARADRAENGSQNGDGNLVLSLEGADADLVKQGDVLHLDLGGDAYLFPVETLNSNVNSSTSVVQGQATAMLALGPAALPVTSPPAMERISRLRWDLYLREETLNHPRLDELGFNDGHPRFWGDAVYLLSSSLYRSSETEAEGEAITAAAGDYLMLQAMERLDEESGGNPPTTALAALMAPIDRDTSSDGEAIPLPTFLPLGMPTLIDAADFSGIDEEEESSPPVTSLGSDGLETFDPEIFFDANLVLTPGSNRRLLMEAAFDRYYRQGIRLRGLHSTTFIDEVALIALPDAVHRDWAPSPDLSLEGYAPWRMVPFNGKDFLVCQGPPEVRLVTPAQGTTAGGTVITILGSGFTSSEQTEVSFGGVLGMEVTVGDEGTLTVTAPPQLAAGPVTVTVRNWNGEGSLIDGFHYTPAPEAKLPLLEDEDDYDEGPLRQVQRNAFDFCQARADVVVILTLPHHYRRRTCIEWLENLREDMGLPRLPVYSNDRRQIVDLSYGAVYHPWLLMGDEKATDSLRPVPADGAVCGQIALREQQRQAWVAPANQPIQGVLGLDPVFSREEWAELFDLNFNLVRWEARAFRPLSAHTLSEDRSLLQLSVRRLMILLRKIAHQRGMDYVFESNTQEFRNSVRFALEELLEGMYEQGAFAGASPAQAFRVSTDTPAQAVERGQFIAQIQVAPSLPMEFITVLMLLVGQDTLQVEES